MEKIDIDQQVKYEYGKVPGPISSIVLIILSLMISSCSAIGQIFKAGMSFGIFIVIAVIVLIIIFFFRFGKTKNS